jgi:hypothetical protein
MGTLRLLFDILAAALPLPVWSDEEDSGEWWAGLGPSVTALIAALVAQFKTTGRATMMLPDGTELIFADSGKCLSCDCDAVEGRLLAIPTDRWVVAVGPEKWGDGKFMEMLMKLLPYIIQILPLFLEPKPAPAPTPDPGVL